MNKGYLYKYLRHPMYLGILLVYATSTTIYSDLFLANIFLLVMYIEIGSYFEEKTLRIKFQRSYEEYMRTTWKYIPFIR